MAGVGGRMLRTAFIVLVAASVALVALLITEIVRGPVDASGAAAVGAGKNDPQGAARNAALQDAKDAAPVLFSYDYRHLDKDLAAARAVTTGDFTTQYDKVSEPAVKPLAIKYKVVVTAKVLGASVVDDSKPNQVKVLLFLDQVVKNSQLPAPRLDANRTVLTMQRVGAQWKVAMVDAI